MSEHPGRIVTSYFRDDRVRRHGSGLLGAVEAQAADGTVVVRFDGSEAGAPCAAADLVLLASGPVPDGVLGPLADTRGSVRGSMRDWDMVSATLRFRGYYSAEAWLRARPERYEDVLTQFDQARAAGRALPVGYWARGEDRWTSREAEDGHVPGDAVWVQPPIEESGPESPFERQLRAGRAISLRTGSAGCRSQRPAAHRADGGALTHLAEWGVGRGAGRANGADRARGVVGDGGWDGVGWRLNATGAGLDYDESGPWSTCSGMRRRR